MIEALIKFSVPVAALEESGILRLPRTARQNRISNQDSSGTKITLGQALNQDNRESTCERKCCTRGGTGSVLAQGPHPCLLLSLRLASIHAGKEGGGAFEWRRGFFHGPCDREA